MRLFGLKRRLKHGFIWMTYIHESMRKLLYSFDSLPKIRLQGMLFSIFVFPFLKNWLAISWFRSGIWSLQTIYAIDRAQWYLCTWIRLQRSQYCSCICKIRLCSCKSHFCYTCWFAFDIRQYLEWFCNIINSFSPNKSPIPPLWSPPPL